MSFESELHSCTDRPRYPASRFGWITKSVYQFRYLANVIIWPVMLSGHPFSILLSNRNGRITKLASIYGHFGQITKPRAVGFVFLQLENETGRK